MTGLSWGWMIGIAVGLILAIIIIKLFNTDGAIKTKYDERQLIVRGNAYRAGFFTMMIANVLMMFLYTGDFGVQVLGYTAFFIPLFAGLIAQVSYSIFKDGYVGLNTNMHRFIIFLLFISAFNLFIGFSAWYRGELMRNGQMTGPFINFLVGLVCILIAVELVIKKCIDRGEE